MTMMGVNFAIPETSPNTDAPSASRWKRDADASSRSGTNAFAASLATAMNTPMAPRHAPSKHGADSELDAHPHDVNATDAGNSYTDASTAASSTAASSTVNATASASVDAASSATGSVGTDDDNSDSGVSSVGAGAYGGKSAFAAAAEARAAAANTPVDSANSDVDALNPDFRAKLGRVVTRMHDEYGKDVQLVEGFRTQSRQDFLYDQGRTSPGDVVTWTKSSKHTLGLAADVTINGSYADAAGFQQLAQVAAQEGLRTLGPKDPGHIEMPTRGGAAAWGSSADSLNIDSNVSRAIGIALDQNSVSGSTDDGTPDLSNLNGLLSRVGRGGVAGTPQFQIPGMAGGNSGLSGGMSQRNPGDPRKDTSRSSDSTTVTSAADVATVAQVAQVAQGRWPRWRMWVHSQRRSNRWLERPLYQRQSSAQDRLPPTGSDTCSTRATLHPCSPCRR